jgi:hypothetical protein
MEEYQREVELVIKDTEFGKSQIFELGLSPFKDEFYSTFRFYREALNRANRFGVENSYIFYTNNRTVNAKAGISKGFGVICINAGLLMWAIKSLHLKENIHSFLEPYYPIIIPYLDNRINTLMYQMTTQFTFYHELAHLVQKSESLKSGLWERRHSINEFDISIHKMEFDADTFAGVFLGGHIQQYCFQIFKDDINTAKIESIIELNTAFLLIYFLSFETNKLKIYYEDNSHPHPIIRILNLVLTITNYLQQSPKIKSKNINLDHREIFSRSIQLAHLIENEIYGTNLTENFQNILNSERTNIINYIKKLRDLETDKFILAIDKWNSQVTSPNIG